MGNFQRLDKILSNSGYGTRKEVKQLVRQCKVTVNGIIAVDSAMHVNPETSVIDVGGERLYYREFIYIMMNKPAGVISATFDDKLKTVIDLLPDKYKTFNPFPVGRLDMDTEGLLIITNDGELAHMLLSPKKRVPKTYYALIDGMATEKDVSDFNEGIILDDGYKTLPAQLKILKQGDISEVEIQIFEGKFHQIKRMFEAVGKRVRYLRRISMGNIELDGNLKTGEFRELNKEEINMLYKDVR
ncbi:MAG: rRNA pseudouridine synthase [Clostridiaceae bacterium]|jgi:16S rRNA pseudouridine516 synthase|nr:rRNA pseudouridine synthase [Clostridiaceae bacterium]